MISQILTARIEKKIYLIRDQKVMFDSDLADLYEVSTKAFNQAVSRNKKRFPDDFMFQLNRREYDFFNKHIEAQSNGRGSHRKYLPYVFTEQGVAMLSSVLHSDRAINVNIQIMRTFVQLREMLISNKDLSKKLNTLERKYDNQFKVVFDAIRELMSPSQNKTKRKIGFLR